MNCCNNKNNNSNNGHSHHMWMMILCCGAPILLLLIISLLGTNFTGIRVILAGILPFVCPIMMIIMIPMMFMKRKGNGKCHEDNITENIDEKENNINL